jgi:hypothetical protein
MTDELVLPVSERETKLDRAKAGKQRIVVVLGMARSGTSLLTNLLKVLGVDLGNDLLPGNSGNEMGYWENEGIAYTQDALMNHIAKDWGGWGFAYPFDIDWTRLPELRPFQEKLTSIVRAEIVRARGIWGFKDPRTSRLLPMWKQIFAELNLEPLYVLAVRDPAVVADSAAKLFGLDPLHSELLWAMNTLDAVRDAGGEVRVVVDYDRWFTSPLEQAQAVAGALDLAWPADDSALADRLTQTIRPGLRHSSARRPCSLPIVTKTYELLKRAAATGRAPDAMARAELRQASEALGGVLELSSGWSLSAMDLGHKEFNLGNLEAAAAAYVRATSLQPKLASAHSSLAEALQMLGRSQDAFASAIRSLSFNSADTVALRVLARIDLDSLRLEAAEKSCWLILQKDANDNQTLQLLKEVLDRKEKARQAAALLFSHSTKPVSAPPIVPAPIFVRRGRTSSPITLDGASSFACNQKKTPEAEVAVMAGSSA